jgi:P-type Ca2+ transporter type 2C
VPFILQSTIVESGEARAIVCGVGFNTCSGKAGKTLDIQNELTPLQMKLETIANSIGKVGLFVAIFTFIILIIKLLIITIFISKRAVFSLENGI